MENTRDDLVKKCNDYFKKFEFVEFLFVAGRTMFIGAFFLFMLFQGFNDVKIKLAVLLACTAVSMAGLISYRHEKENGLLIYYIGVVLQALSFVVNAILIKDFQFTILIFFILPLLMGICLIVKKAYSR